MIKKWFNDTYESWLFILGSAIGVSMSLLTFNLLNGYPFNSGKNLTGVFIPPLISLLYLTYTAYRHNLTMTALRRTLFLYLIQIAPFAPLFFQTFQPTPADDFSRYYLYAKNMIDHHTLWGGDKLFFSDAGYYYATQPGYRYFIAAELLVFGDLYRFVQFINIALLLVATFYFQKVVVRASVHQYLQLCILFVIVLFTPYAIKNLLMGLSEWLTAILLMMVSHLYTIRKNTPAALFILGLVPFFRQNLLVAILLLALWIIFNNGKKLKLIFTFLLSLLLPLYHNLYYAGEWRFLVKVFATPFLNDSQPTGYDFSVFFYNLPRLFGFERFNGHIHFDFMAFLFLPLSVVIYYNFVKKLFFLKRQLLYCLITLSAILPALLLGKDYYPRFEYVSVVMILVTYYLLSEHWLKKGLAGNGIFP